MKPVSSPSGLKKGPHALILRTFPDSSASSPPPIRATVTRSPFPPPLPRAHPASRQTLHLVNDTVVMKRQVLRLVIDGDEGLPATNPSSTPPRAEFDPSEHSVSPPNKGSNTSRLTAARVSVSPTPGYVTPTRSSLSPTGQVRQEMISATGLSPDDARMILARRASESLEGGRLAQLTPAKRRGLERVANAMGLRDFDTNLVIAIAQDAARTGEAITSANVGGRLRLVGGAVAPATAPLVSWGVPLMASLAIAGLALAALVRWVAGQ